MNKTKDKIIKTAEELFIQNGYKSVSMNMIAEKSNITKPSLYYYFKNKEDLYLETLKEVFAEFHQEINKVFKTDVPVQQKMFLFVEKYIDFSMKKRNFIKLIMQNIIQKDNRSLCKRITELRENLLTSVEPLVEEAIKYKKISHKINTRIATCMLMGAIHALVGEVMINSKKYEHSSEELADYVLTAVF